MARSTVSSPLRIHPPELLEQIDARAKALGVSRNEWMVRALTLMVGKEMIDSRKASK